VKSSIMVFLVNAVFFFVVAFVYGTVTEWSEMVGFPALLLTGRYVPE
jgi:positive regulator of sigma E activity